MSELIDRQSVIDAIDDYAEDANKNYEIDKELGLMQARNIVIEAQSVQPETDLQPTCNQLATDLISRQAAIDAYIMKCPYFAGKNTIDRSNIGTHIGSCDLEHHYRKVCPSNECICAERLGLKNG